MPAPAKNRSFADLLAAFTQAIVANDGAGLGALFAPDGVYQDEFFGPHRGRAAIAEMLSGFTIPAATIAGIFSTPSATAAPATQGSASATVRLCRRASGGQSYSRGSASSG